MTHDEIVATDYTHECGSDCGTGAIHNLPQPEGPAYHRICSICACFFYGIEEFGEANRQADWCSDSKCRCHSSAFAEGWWRSLNGRAS